MGSHVVGWAGKRLSDEEAAETRRAVELLRRIGDEDAARNLARFLPESGHPWSPDELETGALDRAERGGRTGRLGGPVQP